MQNELTELLDTAVYKEIASEAFYRGAQKQTTDPGARELMKGLAGEEQKHAAWLKVLKDNDLTNVSWHAGKMADLKLSKYLTRIDSLEGAGLQDTLTLAITREQEAMDFYVGIMGVIEDKLAKSVCQKLAQEELRHKFKLEVLYDDMFYEEN